jgi:hypothetical protein
LPGSVWGIRAFGALPAQLAPFSYVSPPPPPPVTVTGDDLLEEAIALGVEDPVGWADRALERLENLRSGAGKVCSTCKVKRPLSAFGRRLTAPDALDSRCLECAATGRRASRARTRGV